MEFIGFVVILVVGSAVINMLLEAIKEPELINAIGEYSPWLASNSEIISVAAFIVLTIIVLMIPIKLKRREVETGTNGMEVIGMGVSFWFEGVIICLGILATGYIAGIGFLAATS